MDQSCTQTAHLKPTTHRRRGETAKRRPIPYFDLGWHSTAYDVPPDGSAPARVLTDRRGQQLKGTPLFDVAPCSGQHAESIGANCDAFACYRCPRPAAASTALRNSTRPCAKDNSSLGVFAAAAIQQAGRKTIDRCRT